MNLINTVQCHRQQLVPIPGSTNWEARGKTGGQFIGMTRNESLTHARKTKTHTLNEKKLTTYTVSHTLRCTSKLKYIRFILQVLSYITYDPTSHITLQM